jgi:ribosomal protein S18 acetylase RimI-like enzyme
MIYEYQSADEAEIIDCLMELQSAESKIESIRISNRNIAEMYFNEVQHKINNNSGKIFVSKRDNEIAGVLIVDIEENEIYEKQGKHILIVDIVVKSNFRNRGIGKELMKKAETFALENNVSEIRLYTLMKNKAALNLYRNCGYQDFGIALTKKIQNNLDLSQLQIRNPQENEQIPYDLLLLSDDTIEAINKNLHNGELFIGKIIQKTVAAFVLKVVKKDTIEIRNIAVIEELQGKGIGTILLDYIKIIAKKRNFETLLVGTCDQCIKEIAFYRKSGFDITDVRKNFFIDNYREPIFENGVQIKDMIMLSMDLRTKMPENESQKNNYR